MSSVPAVHLESRVLGKSGPTVGALERLRTCVCPLVQQQGSFGAERLSAVRADMSQIITFMYLRSSRDVRQMTDMQINVTLISATIVITYLYVLMPIFYQGNIAVFDFQR